MRKMKDSGIEWIGEIPESWEVHRIKNHFSIISGSGFKTDYQGEESGDLPVCKASDISNAGHRLYGSANYISQEVRQKEGFSVIPAGSILFAKIGEAMKKNNRTLTMVDACADNNCQAMVPQNIHSEYAYYLFSCIDMQWFDNAGTIPCINNTKLLNFKMAYPNMDKQNRIADYLDQKCAEIDAIISAKEKTNELLKERRQSIIYEAVTKGLDPTVPMKDSGVEWIGEIPESWDVGKLGYFIQVFNGDRSSNYPSGNDLQEEGIPFLTSSNLEKDELTLDECKYITQEKYDSMGGFKMQINDIIYCLRGSVGKCSINLTEEQGTVASSLMGIRCTKIDPKFLLYILKSSVVDTQNALFINGTCAANLSAENVLEYRIPILDTQTQVDIVDYLDKKCAEIDALISANESTIEKLKEYRQSVIYEAVTGKVEI